MGNDSDTRETIVNDELHQYIAPTAVTSRAGFVVAAVAGR
jgi:hypothetical protein